MGEVLDFGVDFAGAAEEAEAATRPAPSGVYEVQVLDHKLGETKDGHARIMWKLGIINAPDAAANGKTMNHFTNIPDNGDMTGVGFFTQFLTAIGNPWTGTGFDPDSCKGLSAQANVSVSEDGKWNNIESFV